MADGIFFLFVILVIVIFIFVVRLFGAWMLRIDEVIKNQEKNLIELRRISKKLDSKNISDIDTQEMV